MPLARAQSRRGEHLHAAGARSVASAPRARLLTWLSEAQSMPQDSLRVTICIVPIKKSTYAFGSSESRALW
jgi:hypothetical protein